jgi:methionyl aminopeptidase
MQTDLQQKITAMRTGGRILGEVRDQLQAFTQPGVTFESIEAEAQRLLAERQVVPSFSTVDGYDWATCIMRNEELCHGIPVGKTVAAGDVITIDVGLIYQSYHLDTTITFAVGDVSPDVKQFLERGRQILRKAIAKARAGQSVYEVSNVIEQSLRRFGYGAVYQLIGHGIGLELHMEPGIPCVAYRSDKRVLLEEGQTLAIEVMYAMGDPKLVEDEDGWTYRTADRSLSGMFEETVLVTAGAPEVLTRTTR